MSSQNVSSSAGQTNPGIKGEAIIRATFETLPPAPAFIALARFHYAPGAIFGPAAGPGPVVVRVEAGSLTFRSEGKVSLIRAAARGAQSVEENPAPGTDFTIGPGDQLMIPGNTMHSAISNGPFPAQTIGVAVFPAAPPRQFPQGIDFIPLILGGTTTLPSAPVTVELNRITYQPGASIAARSFSGPALQSIESGTLGVSIAGGDFQVMRAASSAGGPGFPGQFARGEIGSEAILNKGEGAVIQSGTLVGPIRNASDAPVTLLEATIRPKEADMATTFDSGERNKEIVRKFMAEVLDNHNLAVLGDYIAPDFVNHDAPPGIGFDLTQEDKTDFPTVRSFLDGVIFPAFSNFKTIIEEQIAKDDIVVTRWSQSFTNTGSFFGFPATGNDVKIGGTTIIRLRDGKFVEQWEARDDLSWFEQINLVPNTDILSDKPWIQDTKALVSKYFLDAWGAGNLAAVDQVFAPNFVNNNLAQGQKAGREGVKQFADRIRTAFPDGKVNIDLMIDSGDKVIVRWTFAGTHSNTVAGIPATGKRVQFSGISTYTVSGQQITEAWTYWAQLGFLQQLGAINIQPPPGATSPSSTQANEAVARKWVEAVNSGDLQALDQTVDYNVIDHSGLSSGHGHGCEGHKRLVSELRKAFPDWRANVDNVTVNGDLVTIRYTGQGKPPDRVKSIAGNAPAEKMDFKLVSTVRIKDGKVVEHWANEGPLGQKGGPTSAAPATSSGSGGASKKPW